MHHNKENMLNDFGRVNFLLQWVVQVKRKALHEPAVLERGAALERSWVDGQPA